MFYQFYFLTNRLKAINLILADAANNQDSQSSASAQTSMSVDQPLNQRFGKQKP